MAGHNLQPMESTITTKLTDEEEAKLIRLLELAEQSDKYNPLWFGEEDSETLRNIREKL